MLVVIILVIVFKCHDTDIIICQLHCNQIFNYAFLNLLSLIDSYCFGAFPGGLDNKRICYAGDPGSIPGSGRSPGEGSGNPLQYSCLEDPMGKGAWLLDYSPWHHKESDTYSDAFTKLRSSRRYIE